MYLACSSQDVKVITTLLNAGAKIDNKVILGETILMRAAFGNMNPEVISILINAGAKVNIKGDNGRTAMKLRSRKGKEILRAV